ncbi:MAG: HlyD family secretion protein [Bacteroidetes bacterium]|nr:HlyD family secretion protein [Bacteroidota bacterium]
MKKSVITVISLVVLIGSILGWNYIQFLTTHIETDDAQVDGNIVPVNARVGAFVASVHVKDNEAVKQGDLLVTLDTAELSTRVAQARAAYESARTAISVARSTAEDARLSRDLVASGVEEPKTNLWKAKKEYARYEDLYMQNLATQQQFDNVKADLEKAQAQYNMAMQRVRSSEGQLNTALSQLKMAEANAAVRLRDYDYAKLQLSYAQVHAPVDGMVSKKSIQPGQLVQAGQPLMALVQQNEMWVTANYKETQLEGMSVGNKVDILVDAYPDKTFTGKVESVGGATGAKFSLLPPDNASGNFVKVVQRISVRIAIDATPDAVQLLKPGLSVTTVVEKNSGNSKSTISNR